MLNYVAILMLQYMARVPLRDPHGFLPESARLTAAARLPLLFHSRIHLGVVLALALVPLVYVLIWQTPRGFRLRAIGISPSVARFTGINVGASVIFALVFSGALAGLAGIIQVSAIDGRLNAGIMANYGFTAILVALLGRLHPLGVLLAAVFFSALTIGAGAMQAQTGLPVTLAEPSRPSSAGHGGGGRGSRCAEAPMAEMLSGPLIGLLAAGIRLATPVLLAVIGEIISEKSGVLNLELEGLSWSAHWWFRHHLRLAAWAAGGYPLVAAWLGLAAGAPGRVLLGVVLAVLAINLRADQVVSSVSWCCWVAASVLTCSGCTSPRWHHVSAASRTTHCRTWHKSRCWGRCCLLRTPPSTSLSQSCRRLVPAQPHNALTIRAAGELPSAVRRPA